MPTNQDPEPEHGCEHEDKAQKPHGCPYEYDVNDNEEFKCTCCKECEYECERDI